MSGATVLVGAPNNHSLAGAAYVFVRGTTAWTETAELTASDAAPNGLVSQTTLTDTVSGCLLLSKALPPLGLAA